MTKTQILLQILALAWGVVSSTRINSTGGSFPQNLYAGSVFAYQFKSTDNPTYWGASSACGRCNIMGYWHTANAGNPFESTPPSSNILSAQTTLCGKPRSERCANNGCAVAPLVDFGASDTPLSANDYLSFPDLQMFPSVRTPDLQLIFHLIVYSFQRLLEL